MNRGMCGERATNNVDEWVQVEACPVCGADSDSLQPFERVSHDNDATLTYSICAGCGTAFQSPRMSDEALAAYYAGEYRRQVQGEEGPTLKDVHVQGERARNLAHFLTKHLDHLTIHLDIGASTGAFLAETSKRFGCRAIGVEPGVAYRQYAASKGLEIYSDIENLPKEIRGRVDLVSLIHVLEHLPNPIAYLRRLRETWMSEHGWLLLEVPNLFGHMSFELSHLVAFSRDSLLRALWMAGFSSEAVLIHGRPRSRFLKLYIGVLARPGDRAPRSFPAAVDVRKARRRRRSANRIRRWSTRLVPWLVWRPLPPSTAVSELANAEQPLAHQRADANSLGETTQHEEPCS